MANRWLKPGEFREVVQIGAVKVDGASFEVIAEFEVLVCPRINKALSPYFENLTGITNAALAARGADIREAYERFVAFAGEGPIISFGRDDIVLAHNLALYGIAGAAPLPAHHNIAPWLNANGVATNGLHACDVARACGVSFKNREHDALEDARSLVAGARALIGRGAANIFSDARA
ncbi:MAG: exonuclease domain-containing protein [Proteobacteria bacterium]|nr:exonuclease domain-containing protein [Pseudomonadota bacterium]